jgi:hypothetical protein
MNFLALHDDVQFIIATHLASDLKIRALLSKNHDVYTYVHRAEFTVFGASATVRILGRCERVPEKVSPHTRTHASTRTRARAHTHTHTHTPGCAFGCLLRTRAARPILSFR